MKVKKAVKNTGGVKIGYQVGCRAYCRACKGRLELR